MTEQDRSPAARLAQLIVEFSVRHLETSLSFYQALGFRLQRRTDRFAVLQWDDAVMYLIEEPGRPAVPGPSIVNILLLVPNVDEIWSRAQSLGVPVERAIADWYYGLRDFILVDPDGFGVRFGQTLPRPS